MFSFGGAATAAATTSATAPAFGGFAFGSSTGAATGSAFAFGSTATSSGSGSGSAPAFSFAGSGSSGSSASAATSSAFGGFGSFGASSGSASSSSSFGGFGAAASSTSDSGSVFGAAAGPALAPAVRPALPKAKAKAKEALTVPAGAPAATAGFGAFGGFGASASNSSSSSGSSSASAFGGLGGFGKDTSGTASASAAAPSAFAFGAPAAMPAATAAAPAATSFASAPAASLAVPTAGFGFGAPAAAAPATAAPTAAPAARIPPSSAQSLFAAAAAPPSAAAPSTGFSSFGSSAQPAKGAFSSAPAVAASTTSAAHSGSSSLSALVASRPAATESHPSRNYFSVNLQQHPVWPHLAALGAFAQPPHKQAAQIDSSATPTKEKGAAPVEATPPMESRLAASHAGHLFVLAPPSAASPPSAGAHHARLFFMDLKPLHTTHLRTRAEQSTAGQAPPFRELLCSPAPLPAHSHTLQLNSQASYAVVHSTNTVYLIYLAANKLEKALLNAEGGAEAAVKVKTAAVGSWFHQNNTSLQVLQVSFHPLSDVHLLILTNDSVLRVYNIKENLNLPCQEFALDSVAHAPLDSPNAAASTARRDSGASWVGNAPQRNTHAAFGQTKPMATGFCFGAQPASRASTAATAAGGSPNWDLFSLYFLYASGSIAMVCPTLPPKVGVDRRTVASMRRAEQARLDRLQQAVADRVSIDEEVGPYDLTVQQLQARLLWIGDTFGMHADEDDEESASGGVLVSQDLSAAVASGMPAAWIQPAQPCGANAQTAQNAHSQSFLALPGSASAASAYPYPASHLFSFRHAWPCPPGRFFRSFIDGRLDLLLSLQPVQPLFVTRNIAELCGEVDAAATPTVVHPSAALDEMCSLLAPGGPLESYCVSTFLLPADVSRLEGVEPPVLGSASSGQSAVANGSTPSGSLSRAASLQSPPTMLRPTSSASPSLTRGGSNFAATAQGVASLGSPLQPFNPQFRPLIDVHDGSGLFVAHPRGLGHVSYGEQLNEIGAILARGEEDAFSAVQSCFEHMHCEQRSMTAPLPLGATRHVVGAVLLDDPLLGRYLLQLTAGSASGSVAVAGPHIDVVELSRRSAPSAPSIRSLMDGTSTSTRTGASHSSRTVAEVTQALASTNFNEEMKELGKYLTPFDEEIRPFLARMRALPPPPRLTPVSGGTAAILNSPEALGEFLSIRKHFVGAIQDLTAVQTLLSTRVEMLGAFALEQQRLFSGLERDVVRARAQQAKLDDQLETHLEMQKHLGQSALDLQSQLSLQLHDLSPAEVSFHTQLVTLRDTLLPQLTHKQQELQRKEEHMRRVQRELAQAARAHASKGIAGPESKNAWSEQQLQAVKPVIANQSTAISSLMSQLAELKKNMTTLRSHSALQRAAQPHTQTHLLMPPQEQPALMPDEQ